MRKKYRYYQIGGEEIPVEVNDMGVKAKAAVLIAIIGAASALFLLTVGMAGAFTWWDNDFHYRREITVASEDNYQLRIVVPNYANIYFDNYMDVRFTENIDGPPLPYWCENYTGDNAVFWVYRSENADDSIYLYYGNSSAVNNENGYRVFVQFDDFDWGYSVGDLPKTSRGWALTGVINAGDNYEIAANPDGPGQVLISRESGDDDIQRLWNENFPEADNYCIGLKCYAASYQDGEMTMNAREGGKSGTRIGTARSFKDDGVAFEYYYLAWTGYSPALSGKTSRWMWLEYRIADDYDLMMDDELGDAAFRTSPTAGADTFDFYPEADKARTAYLDDFFVAKWPAPSYTIGGEGANLPPAKPQRDKPVENRPYFEWSGNVATSYYRLLVDNDSDFSSPLGISSVENIQQLENDLYTYMHDGAVTKFGFKKDVYLCRINSVSFRMRKTAGLPTGPVTFTVRYSDNDGIIQENEWGDASEIPTSAAWVTATFQNPPLITGNIRCLVEFENGDSSNKLSVRWDDSKPGFGELTWYFSGWGDFPNYDATFKLSIENNLLIENYYFTPESDSYENGVYYWKVIGYNAMGENESDVWSFVVGSIDGVDSSEITTYAAIALMSLALAIAIPIGAMRKRKG